MTHSQRLADKALRRLDAAPNWTNARKLHRWLEQRDPTAATTFGRVAYAIAGGAGSTTDNARAFVAASSHKITLGLGALNFAFGPGTITEIIQTPATLINATMLSAGALASTGYSFSNTAGGLINLAVTGASNASNVTTLSVSKWYLVAVTKATGTVAPRFHIYDYAAGTWVHENSATSIANSSTPATRAALGVNAAGTGSFFGGVMYAAGVWNVVLTDLQVEELVKDITLTFWSVVATPKGMWILNQASTGTSVTDLTGNGANQSAITGTTVSTFPYANDDYGSPELGAGYYGQGEYN